ncbi:hypothetical protein JB92DRAFT_2899150 [Gautieria morchelliformis]|nr:hypothetical protein JB92DRAFT_2899150 [Gautieria morchelliformis]
MTDRGHGRGTQPGQGQASDGQNLSASSDNPGAAHPSLPRLPFPGHGQRPSASGNNPGPVHHSTRRNRPPEHLVEPLDRLSPSVIPHAENTLHAGQPPSVSRSNPGPAHHSVPYAPRLHPPGPPSGDIQGSQGQSHAQGTRRNRPPEHLVQPLDRLSPSP